MNSIILGKILGTILWVAVILVAPLVVVLISTPINAYGTLAVLVSFVVTVILLKRKAWISFAFLSINTLFAALVFAKIFFTAYYPDAWRADLYSKEFALEAFKLTLHFLLLASAVFFAFSRGGCSLVICVAKDRRSRLLYVVVASFILVSFLIVDYKFLQFGKFFYGNLSSGIPYLEVIAVLAYISILDFRNIVSTRGGKGYCALLLFCVLSIFAFGFRGVVLGCLVVLLCKLLEDRRVKIVPISVFFLMAFSIFVLVGVMRSEHELSASSIVAMTGRHEENEFYTLLLSLRSPGVFESNSYIGSLMRLLGSGALTVSSKFSEAVLPAEINSVGANMGMYFLSEAFLNFGYVGALVFSVVVCVAISIIEMATRYFVFVRCVAVLILAQAYTLVYYGSSNFISMVVQGSVILFCYALYARFRLL